MTNLSEASEIRLTEPVVRKRVLIVGGSTRAAAVSALRAGLQPVCADLFADLDTRQMADVIAVRNYPDSLPEDVAQVQADGWFYTGALENRPDLIERMGRPNAPYGPLWGTSPAALRLIRDPFWVAEILSCMEWPCGTDGLEIRPTVDQFPLKSGAWPTLDVLPQSSPPSASGLWMRKPLSSAGGRAVCVWDDQISLSEIAEPVYFQRRKHGKTLSAVFRRIGASVELQGMTRQLTGNEWSRAAEPYLYCGSIGPLSPDPSESALSEQIHLGLIDAAERLATASGLQGTFGIDFIQDENGVPWILEVNPRYTASVEVLELALQQSLLFVPGIPVQNRSNVDSVPVVAKLILYAPAPFIAPDFGGLCQSCPVWEAGSANLLNQHPDLGGRGSRRAETSIGSPIANRGSAGASPSQMSASPSQTSASVNDCPAPIWEVPGLADVPVPGTVVEATWPICTVMAAGSTEAECLRSLRDRVDTVWKMVNHRAHEFPIRTHSHED